MHAAGVAGCVWAGRGCWRCVMYDLMWVLLSVCGLAGDAGDMWCMCVCKMGRCQCSGGGISSLFAGTHGAGIAG
eukprot:scaffold95719_cov23-Tisochrysis_lutea.AAC.1